MDPLASPLTQEETRAAAKDLVIHYPKVKRSDTDVEIPNQHYGLASFILFKEPKKATDGSDSIVYGIMKLRGNYADENLAVNKAGDIIRNQDSVNKIKILPIGHWVPIVSGDAGMKEVIDIRTDKKEEEEALQRKALREEKEKVERQKKELEERLKEVKESRDYNDDQESLDYYTLKQVTRLRLNEYITIKQKELKDLYDKLEKVTLESKTLESSHPNYRNEWLDNYNAERRKSGIPDYVLGVEEQKMFDS